MNRARWEHWRRSPAGQIKDSIFSELVADNEPLVEKFASEFLKRTRCYTGHIVDDLFQAARIGIMEAIRRWDPERGSFSTIAFHCARYEMQGVLKNGARPISIDRRANISRAKQDAAAAFYAQHGRHPTPAELGISESDMRMDERANATYLPETEADGVAAEDDSSPEERIDRARDTRALQTWLSRLSPKDKKAFWAGKRPDLEAAAKEYVAQRRAHR